MSDLVISGTLLVPLAGAVVIAVTGKRPNLRETVTLVTAVTLFGLVASLLPEVLRGKTLAGPEFQILPDVKLGLSVEPLGLVYALLASFLWIFNSIYSIGYMRALEEKGQTRFYVCFAIALMSVMGMAFASNLLTLFVFYEVLTFSTFPLVTHKRTPEAVRSGRIYLGFLVGTSTCLLLLAIIWTWVLAGTTEFQLGGILAGTASPAVLGALLVLFVLGTGKAAVMPFHFWLPQAMVAPTPVSALLHAVAVVKAGVFVVLKIVVYVVGLDVVREVPASDWLCWMAAATILIGSIAALAQDNLKARLAYSTISQLSYIVLGAVLGTTLSVTGGGLHMVMHAFGKITLFFCAGAIYVATHRTRVSQLGGLGRVMPWTMGAFLIGALSNVGVPPLGAAWSKWFLALGTLQAQQWVFLVVYMLSSILALAYLLPIPFRAFFSPAADAEMGSERKEAPLPCLIALSASSVGCVALFVAPGFLKQLLDGITG